VQSRGCAAVGVRRPLCATFLFMRPCPVKKVFTASFELKNVPQPCSYEQLDELRLKRKMQLHCSEFDQNPIFRIFNPFLQPLSSVFLGDSQPANKQLVSSCPLTQHASGGRRAAKRRHVSQADQTPRNGETR
jgi:hypothetical protein